jgi:type IV pilus assembly protein PilC
MKKFLSLFAPKLSSLDHVLFAKRLSFLLGAHMPLHSALQIITSQSRKSIQPIFEAISEHVHQGKTLSLSLSQFPKSFPSYMVTLVQAGEKYGLLEKNLLYLADEIQRRKQLKQKILSALLYPVCIALGTITLTLFLIIIIFPKVRSLFASMRSDLPLSTRILISVSEFLQKHGVLLVIILLILTVIFIVIYKKYPRAQYIKDSLLLSTPLIGKLIQTYILSRFLKTTGIMLKARIPITQAIDSAAISSTNILYREALSFIAMNLNSGITLSHSIKAFPQLFPSMIIELIDMGETSGTLADVMIYISDMYDQELEERLKMIVHLIEPILMLTMGLVVGFIAISIISPIYEITQNIKRS